MSKKACHSELVSETKNGGESLPLARTSSLATPSPRGKAPKTPEVSREFCETKLDSERKRTNNAPVDSLIEAPYELPKGWKWCRLGDVCKTFADGDWIESKDQSESGIRLVQTGNIGNGEFRDKEDKYHYISEETFKKLKCTEIFPGDILISRLPEPVGRSCIIPDSNYKMITAVDCTIIRLFENITCKNWFCYYTQSHVYAGLIHELCTGTTRLRISRKNLGEIPFPLPPTLTEQQRIVNRIETMFAKLDEAKEKAQNVVDSFETRKAAILHKAFTGELTANWRKENGVSDDSWKEKRLEEICEKIVCGKTPTGYISSTGEIPYLKVYNISNNNIDFDTIPQFIPKEIHNGKLASSILKPYDVVMNIVGPPLRKIAIIPNTYLEWNMNQAIVRFRALSGLNYRYLYWSLINPKTLSSVIEETRGVVGQQNISVSQSRDLIISVPSLPEQQEIVRILDTVLEKESRAKDAAQNVLDQIALLKKSILARAFRGEL